MKKKENRRFQNKLRLAIQREETRDKEDKAKTAAKIFINRREGDLSQGVSPALDFDSAMHGNNNERQYVL